MTNIRNTTKKIHPWIKLINKLMESSLGITIDSIHGNTIRNFGFQVPSLNGFPLVGRVRKISVAAKLREIRLPTTEIRSVTEYLPNMNIMEVWRQN